MDKQTLNQITEIISKYELTDKIKFSHSTDQLVILGHNRRTKSDYANIINVIGEIEEIVKKKIMIVDESKSRFDFDDDSEWDD